MFLCAFFVDNLFGKLKSVTVAFCLSSLALSSLLFIESERVVRNSQLVLCTGLVVLMISVGLSALFAVVPESYPVSLRGVASGWSASMSRFAGIVSPIAASYLIESTGTVSSAVVLYICSCLASGAFGLIIPPLRKTKK
jgi:nitrate/nitrite transporter NarK